MTANSAPKNAPLLESHRLLLERARQRAGALERRLVWIGNARFAVALFVLALVMLALVDRLGSAFWFAPLIVGFAILSIVSDINKRRLHIALQSAAFQERAIARMEDRWAGNGISGEAYAPPDHPCAGDLDFFGTGSLFERLCLCATESGRETLAQWLLIPAAPSEIGRRQEAVGELSALAEWREHAFILGSEIGSGIRTDALQAWGHLPGASPRRLRLVAPFLVGLTSLALFGWISRWCPPALVGLFLMIQGAFAVAIWSRVQRALSGLSRRSRDLQQLAALLHAVERQSFTAPLLRELQSATHAEGLPPSEQLRRLARLIDLLDQPRNFVFALIAPFLLWTTQVALAIEAWRRRTGPVLGCWLRAIGAMEALGSIAAYAAENPDDPYPEVVDGDVCFESNALGHPLIPRSRCIDNDLRLNGERRLLIISGSNMSGKSTLLRSAGINAVLAQMGAPVRAMSLRMSPLIVGATLRIQDSLQDGKSRFYAEITRLRQIVDLAGGPLPVLFLLDEILHGTNSHDRKLGAEAIVQGLLQQPTIGLVTTHDLALTQMAVDLAPLAANCHFSDELINGELHFDYTLRDGPVRHSNALALMRAVGLKVD